MAGIVSVLRYDTEMESAPVDVLGREATRVARVAAPLSGGPVSYYPAGTRYGMPGPARKHLGNGPFTRGQLARMKEGE